MQPSDRRTLSPIRTEQRQDTRTANPASTSEHRSELAWIRPDCSTSSDSGSPRRSSSSARSSSRGSITHRRRRPQKGLPYESGIDTIGDTWSRFGLAFYLYALLFVAFDVEIVFVYLWAVSVRAVEVPGDRGDRRLPGDPDVRRAVRLAEGRPPMAVTTPPKGAKGKKEADDGAQTALVPAVTPRDADRDPRPGRRRPAAPRVRDGGAPAGRLPRPAGGDPDPGRLAAGPDPRQLAVAAPLRASSCCAIEMMSTRHQQERHRSLRDVPVPRLPAPGGRADRGRHADDQDGRPAGPPLGADARAEVVRGDGDLHHLRGPLQAHLQRRAGRGPGHAGRRLRPGLPTAAGGPDLRA